MLAPAAAEFKRPGDAALVMAPFSPPQLDSSGVERSQRRGVASHEDGKAPLTRGFRPSDRGGRTRTCNPRFWRPVLCQLSYAPRLGQDLIPVLRGLPAA